MIISFTWTTPAVVIGEKCVTRRIWTRKTTQNYQNAMASGELVQAYDKSPRHGGKQFGTIRILNVFPKEHPRMLQPISPRAWRDEGFHILTLLGIKTGKYTPEEIWRMWQNPDSDPQTVIRFTLVELNDHGMDIQAQTREKLNKLKHPPQ